MNIRKNDIVVLIKDITGNPDHAKGHRARVLSVLRGSNRIIVEGVNYRVKHMRRSQRRPEGGRSEIEAPIDVSNVMLYCPKCERGVKVYAKTTGEGRKTRVCKTCNETIGEGK